MPIARDFNVEIDADDVLRAQGADPAVIRARRPIFVEIAERAMAEGVPLLKPVVLFRRLGVEELTHEQIRLENGATLKGPLIAQHLGAASEVVVAVCTIGDELEIQAVEVIGDNATFGLALDGVGSAAAEALAVAACHRFEQEANKEGLKSTSPINPGMVGWGVYEGQQQILEILDTNEIGVQLLPTGMMLPRKSLSLVIGLGADVQDGGIPCDHCSMKERCRYRSDEN